jgi:group II intron reverse transcriptase/maturase
MQSAETVLGVLRERGRRSLPCNELYRQLFNPQLFLLAYGRIYANKGAMTPGVTEETVDGMSMAKIARIIDAMRSECYRFTPVRRTWIPKKNGTRRPLGLPTWSDKLVGEVVRLLSEAYYEPTFPDRSHGFRPGRGCHTALREVAETWTGTTWFIEGDISDCFGSLDHQVLLPILAEKIHDNRFLQLISRMLKAGYMDDWVFGATLSGAPQGGVVSPILSNIYLDRLDKFAETVLIPKHTSGRRRADNPAYRKPANQISAARRRGDRSAVRELGRRMRCLPSQDPNDPGYRRLHYARYADDHLLGFTGPRAEAEQIKAEPARFLADELRLELSPDKTLITHGRTGAARFLGYEITIRRGQRLRNGRRTGTGNVDLRVPRSVIRQKCAPHLKRGEPACRSSLLSFDDYAIVATFGAEYRGIVQYYLLAWDVYHLDRLHWVMQTSLLKTLAGKHRSTAAKMARKHKTTIDTPFGPRLCLEAGIERPGRKPLTARFGGIPLHRKKDAIVTDRIPDPRRTAAFGKELIHRFLTGRCGLCGTEADCEVHHIRKLADLDGNNQRGSAPTWVAWMTRQQRKTLVVCMPCHTAIHAGANT